MLRVFWFNMYSIRSTNFQISTRSIQSCLHLHSFCASLGHSLTMWLIVALALQHILHFFCSCYLSIFALITLVRIACSSVENINLFVSHFRVPFRNHWHLSWFPIYLVCCTNWLHNILSSQEIVLSSLFWFLTFMALSRIGSIKSLPTDLTGVANDFFNLQSVTKIIETHYTFIKKVHQKTLELLKVTQNPPSLWLNVVSSLKKPWEVVKTRNEPPICNQH